MQTYPVDIDPEQIVLWIMAEAEAAPSAFMLAARRRSEVREIPVRREDHLGDVEREDLSEIATIATLEVTPAQIRDGWLLTVTVEDEAGPRVSEGDEAAEGEQQIGLNTFYEDFIRPGRGRVDVVAEVANPAAKARMTRLLNAIETNRHKAKRSASRERS